ncbi:MAG: hypothetical protein ACLGHN_04420 [Bacteriovoracia bacterium]
MLQTLTKKLCPFLSLALATVGCGKKIADSETEPARQVEYQKQPSAYILRLDSSARASVNYSMPDAANFEIPDRIKVRSGDPSGKIVEIVYDVNKYDSQDYEFKCSYSSTHNPSEMVLQNCVNYDNEDYGNVEGHIFTLYKNDIIQLRLAGAEAGNLVVEAIYSMAWF